jgi:hypothetical protein
MTVSLPQLQPALDSTTVKVTWETSASMPLWLKFDPVTLTLSGTAPSTDTGKTYHLVFRAQAADGLESFLQLAVTLIAQPKP